MRVKFNRLRSVAAAGQILVAVLLLGVSAQAADLPVPTGPVVLTVTGDIAHANADGAAQFDMAMLRALPARRFVTTTIWTDGPQEFVGVSLEMLLTHLGVTGGMLQAQASNDYAVSIPVSDAMPDGPMIAYNRNGIDMARRDKGPLWIVYPYDEQGKFRTDTIHARSIWQLDRIQVKAAGQ